MSLKSRNYAMKHVETGTFFTNVIRTSFIKIDGGLGKSSPNSASIWIYRSVATSESLLKNSS